MNKELHIVLQSDKHWAEKSGWFKVERQTACYTRVSERAFGEGDVWVGEPASPVMGLAPGWCEVQCSLVYATVTHAQLITVPEQAVVPHILLMNPWKDSEKLLVQPSHILASMSTFKSL